MKKVGMNEMRKVNGGAWKCKNCKQRFWTLSAILWGPHNWGGCANVKGYSWCW